MIRGDLANLGEGGKIIFKWKLEITAISVLAGIKVL